MAIAVRCEACQIEASAATPADLRTFFDRHRDPDACAAALAARGTDIAMWLPLPRIA